MSALCIPAGQVTPTGHALSCGGSHLSSHAASMLVLQSSKNLSGKWKMESVCLLRSIKLKLIPSRLEIPSLPQRFGAWRCFPQPQLHEDLPFHFRHPVPLTRIFSCLDGTLGAELLNPLKSFKVIFIHTLQKVFVIPSGLNPYLCRRGVHTWLKAAHGNLRSLYESSTPKRNKEQTKQTVCNVWKHVRSIGINRLSCIFIPPFQVVWTVWSNLPLKTFGPRDEFKKLPDHSIKL